MNQSLSAPLPGKADDRWTFLRDVVVFQLKLLVDNVRDFLLAPISLGAALIDLVFKGGREGDRFYKVLEWASHSEKVIDVYSALERRSPGENSEMQAVGGRFTVSPDYTIDGVIARLEGVLVRECEKGGTAASVKAAMDRAFDQLHTETSKTRDKATDMVSRAADKLRARSGAETEK